MEDTFNQNLIIPESPEPSIDCYESQSDIFFDDDIIPETSSESDSDQLSNEIRNANNHNEVNNDRVLSDLISDIQSNASNSEIIEETELSESDDESDNSYMNHAIPLLAMVQTDFVPETDLSDNDELENQLPFENTVVSSIDIQPNVLYRPITPNSPDLFSDSSLQSIANSPNLSIQENEMSNANSPSLFSDNSILSNPVSAVNSPIILAQSNVHHSISPDLFSEISSHSYEEVLANDTDIDFNINDDQRPPTPNSPDLFGDDDDNEIVDNNIRLGIAESTHSLNLFANDIPELLNNNQQNHTEEIPPTPFTYPETFQFIPIYSVNSPQRNHESQLIAPAIEVQDSDDETILDIPDNTIVISAESKSIIERIENFTVSVVNGLKKGRKIQVIVQNRSNWDNCYIENERFVLLPITNARCRHIRATFCLSLIFFMLAEIHLLLSTNQKCTVRELYYKNISITQRQENVNGTLKVICCLLDASPWQLGVLSSSKGLIAGPLQIQLPDNSIIDCSIDRNGITLPHLTSEIIDLRTTARHILLVEKDTVFRNLIQNNIIERWNNNCILITGKGYPDINTRLILNKLREMYSLPINIITDADPYGVEIMLTYRHGSMSMSNLAESLAVPAVRWLGIFPTDIRKFGIRAIPLTQEDKRKLDNILNRPYINDHVHRELLIMKQINLKAEIEAISDSSCTYLIDVYLRNKIDNNNGI